MTLSLSNRRWGAQPRRRGRQQRIEGWQALGFASPALLGVALFTVFPVGLSIAMSLFDWPTFGERQFVGLDNYVRLFTDSPDFWPALRNTLVFTALAVPVNVSLALALAWVLGPRIKGRAALRVLFFIPVVTPLVATVMVWKMMLQPQGLVDGVATSWFGWDMPNLLADPVWAMAMLVVVCVWQGLGYNMIIFSAAIEQLPESVMEAATVDGARGARRFFSIVLPMISPAVFFATIMSMIASLQVFVQPQLLTGGGPGNSTQPLVMFIYNQGFLFQQLGFAAAAAWILFAIIIVITALQFRAQRRWVHYEH